jgi:hypothetical protein
MAGIDQYTVLMLHGNGTNASTTIVDSSINQKTATAFNGAQISTGDFKFGGGSINFTTQFFGYVEVDYDSEFDFGSNDFTIDFWTKITNIAVNRSVISQGTSIGLSWRFLFDSNTARFTFSDTANSINITLSAGWVPNTGTWYHIAISRYGDDFYLFIDGIKVATVTNSSSLTSIPHPIYVGTFAGNTNSALGFIDEVRISNGIARWIDDFTPPDSEYTQEAGNNLQLKADIGFLVNQDLEALYEIYLAVGKNIDLLADIGTNVNNDLELVYDLFQTLFNDVILRADTGYVLSHDFVTQYRIRRLIPKLLELKANIGHLVNQNLELEYLLYNFVNRNISLLSDIGFKVNNDTELQYRIIGSITKLLFLRYNLQNFVSNNLILRSNIGSLVNNDSEFPYSSQAFVRNNLNILYNIGFSVNNDLELVYDLIAHVTKDLNVLYNRGDLVNRNLEIPYDLIAFARKDFQTIFNIYALIRKNLELKYNISFDTIGNNIEFVYNFSDFLASIHNNITIPYNIKEEILEFLSIYIREPNKNILISKSILDKILVKQHKKENIIIRDS